MWNIIRQYIAANGFVQLTDDDRAALRIGYAVGTQVRDYCLENDVDPETSMVKTITITLSKAKTGKPVDPWPELTVIDGGKK